MDEDEQYLIAKENSLYSMAETKEESEQALMIVLLEGELLIDIQYCSDCKPTRLVINKQGSNIYIPPNTTYKMRNSQMRRTYWIEVIMNDPE